MNTKEDAMKRLTVLLDPSLLNRFKALASLESLSMSDVVRKLIADWIKEREPALTPIISQKEPPSNEQLQLP
jgi:metal-responsive CopG/Arc/MetJ family transcriptional regulator